MAALETPQMTSSTPFSLAGKKALVCAASQGLGKAAAQALTMSGATVMVTSRSEDKLQNLVKELEMESSQPAYYLAGDLEDPAHREALVESAQEHLGQIDIIVHNCGGPKPVTARQASLADWQDGFNHLFLPVVHLNQLVLDGMIQRHHGRIIAITSIAGREPAQRLAISNAMRAGLQGLFKTLADEVAQYGITVNTVAPGYVATERLDELYEGPDAAEKKRQAEEAIPAKTFGDPLDIGHAVAYLASNEAKYVNGTSLIVDGSRHRFMF